MTWKTLRIIIGFVAAAALAVDASAQEQWVAAWTGASQGPYPAGAAVAQPDLRFAFPGSTGANDQTFRLIVRPDVWGRRIRLRFSNVFGNQPVTLGSVFVGVQGIGANLLPGTNRPVTFEKGAGRVTLPVGRVTYSDAVVLDQVTSPADMIGRKLAVSFHVVGLSGPMTWHAKAMTTSYITAPRSGAHGMDEGDRTFSFTTTSWYFLDAVDVMTEQETVAIAALGDSITDGTLSTLNGDDRWTDFLAARLHAVWGRRVSVVNLGIGGNEVIGPDKYSVEKPTLGGPSALQRLDRDVVEIAGLRVVIWLEGINDFGLESPPASVEAVMTGLREGVRRLHARGIKVIGGTLTTSLGSAGAHGTAEVDAKRRAVNEFIRTGGVFDGVADFDVAVLDAATGMLRPEFQPGSTVGGPGDRIHPNRAGYQAMANAIDLDMLAHVVGVQRR